eukprot:TRINITY_DN1481_c0_g1_i1.p1 TRINITY_DN1481_c0_g1~~TRINITY_DN1481_c0_g1_i1.p1  ORF type:complete len:392 (-),score=84.28 TRINITY_DN1481_c0_g1_i1:34-1209(-)
MFERTVIKDEVQSFFKGMPKASLHIHIEGSFEPELAFKIAQRNGFVPGSPEFPWTSSDQLKESYNFSCLGDFLDTYYKVSNVMLKREDFKDLAQAYAEKCRDENVLHIEPFFDPQTHTSRGVAFQTVIDGLFDGFEAVPEVSCRLIVSLLRDAPVGTNNGPVAPSVVFKSMEEAHGWNTMHQAVEYNKTALESRKLIGLGLDSNERGYPPALFKEHYKYGQSQGLKLTCHAGEEGPPQNIIDSLDILNCDRIDHGIRIMDDAALVTRLVTPAEDGSKMCFTVCPRSNYKLQVFPDPSKSNILEMLDQGLCVTVNSDDPSFFGGYETEQFVGLAEWLFNTKRPMTMTDVKTLVSNGFRSAWIAEDKKQEYLAAVDAYFAKMPTTTFCTVREY